LNLHVYKAGVKTNPNQEVQSDAVQPSISDVPGASAGNSDFEAELEAAFA
jgi:hypothetical protein